MKSISQIFKRFNRYLEQPVSIAPLVTFRIVFGLVMLFSTFRYMYMGWVDTQLVDPIIHFSYYGFEWIKPLPRLGMFSVFIIMALACIAITTGFFYRLFSIVFFLCFSYVELIDIAYYLNHYYFVSIVSFIMILLPANKYFALDVWRKPEIRKTQVNRWATGAIKLQIAIVYVYAGLAKINSDWLFDALPLAIWLPAKTSIPIIGSLFHYETTAYLFSWAGMLFDTFIVFFLLFKRTRPLAFIAVIVFHTLTGILFQIGVFPLVMILSVIIFFSEEWHQRLLQHISVFIKSTRNLYQEEITSASIANRNKIIVPFLAIFFAFQFLFPLRYLLYPGNIFWTEEGYRFSWRVMLMEKAGTATFYVKDGAKGREGTVINNQFLNEHQEKQMAMQPDLVLQFAHFLKEHFKNEGMKNPMVRADVRVTLNAKPARQLVNPKVNLAKIQEGWAHKNWILPFNQSNRK